MKKVRIISGGEAALAGSEAYGSLRGGNVSVTVPGGTQLTKVMVVPGTDEETGVTGTWVQINEQFPMFTIIPLILCRDDFGYCCPPTESGIDECGPYTRAMNDDCDRYPGEVQIVINIGSEAYPEGIPGTDFEIGAPAAQWLIMYVGG